MIKVEISGETPEDFAVALAAFTGLLGNGSVRPVPTQLPAETKPAKGKKTPPADPTGAAADAVSAEPSAVSGASDASPVTREAVGKKCMEYGQPSKGGPQALKELFTKYGSAQGNFSGVPEANLAGLAAELDGLLG